MKAPPNAPTSAIINLNHLRRGDTYRATTRTGPVTGEYLGIETPHGDRAILLRHPGGTESIALCQVTSIQHAAA
jgi:hypothetical protein